MRGRGTAGAALAAAAPRGCGSRGAGSRERSRGCGPCSCPMGRGGTELAASPWDQPLGCPRGASARSGRAPGPGSPRSAASPVGIGDAAEQKVPLNSPGLTANRKARNWQQVKGCHLNL